MVLPVKDKSFYFVNIIFEVGTWLVILRAEKIVGRNKKVLRHLVSVLIFNPEDLGSNSDCTSRTLCDCSILKRENVRKLSGQMLNKIFQSRVGALVQWLWEATHVLEVVGSNPSTVYWMGIFHNYLLLKL